MVVMIRAPMWAKSVAAWNIMVFASSIDRAEHVVRRIGWCVVVNVEGGPRMLHTGIADWSHIEVKSPNPMAARYEGNRHSQSIIECVDKVSFKSYSCFRLRLSW